MKKYSHVLFVALTVIACSLLLHGCRWQDLSFAPRDATAPPTTTPTPTPTTPPTPTQEQIAARQARILQGLRSSNEDAIHDALFEVSELPSLSSEIYGQLDALGRTHASADVRESVIMEIPNLSNPIPLIGTLRHAINDRNEFVRDTALMALEDIEDVRAIDVLIEALSSRYRDTRDDARDALETVTGKEFSTPAQWRSWWQTARASFRFE